MKSASFNGRMQLCVRQRDLGRCLEFVLAGVSESALAQGRGIGSAAGRIDSSAVVGAACPCYSAMKHHSFAAKSRATAKSVDLESLLDMWLARLVCEILSCAAHGLGVGVAVDAEPLLPSRLLLFGWPGEQSGQE